ncbi:MAG: glycosyl hydrolase [Haloarculaceae archaeon]
MQWELTRRRLATGIAGLTGLLAGCPGGGEETETPTETATETGTATGTPTRAATETGTETPTETDAGPPDSIVQVGAGSYRTTKPENVGTPPEQTYLADGVSPPIPTNSWWTTLAWDEMGGNLWSHPFVTQPGLFGLRIGFPQEWAVTQDGPSGPNFAHLPASFDVTLAHESASRVEQSVVTGWGDWSVDYRLEASGGAVDLTQVQGLPYLFATFADGGGAELSFESTPEVWAEAGATLGVTAGGSHYGVYAPEGATWSGTESDTLTSDLGEGDYLTVAALPAATAEALDRLGQYAHNHVTDTRIDWTYAQEDAEVRTTYSFEVDQREGGADGTFTGLYPHQHKYTDASLTGDTYVSPRGTMKAFAGSSFEVVHPFQGLLPFLPDRGAYDEAQVRQSVEGEASGVQMRSGPESPPDGEYWTGKNFFRIAQLLPVAEQVGADDPASSVADAMREELEGWFSAVAEGEPDTRDVFYYNDTWGTLQGYPAGFGAPAGLNDHHFHYGYFVRGAAALARRDPEWASEEAYGGMVDLLIRDYANPARDHDMFPFLRNFEPYAGHSFAGGTNGGFAAGNNQESSSEAINAYAAMALWGAYTGDEQLRDAGVFLYTQESLAAREYWFDVDGENLPDLEEWPYDYACQVWGSGVAWTTWWTDEVEAIYLINVLPVGGYSLHLGLDDAAAGRAYEAMMEHDDNPYNYYPGIAAKFRGLSDTADALDRWDQIRDSYSPGLGETRAHTMHWLYNLDAMGSPTPEVTADAPLYNVFEADDGTRTYVAYNAGEESREMTFSDGTTLSIDSNSLGVTSE